MICMPRRKEPPRRSILRPIESERLGSLNVIVGNPSTIAIESGLTHCYADRSQLGLGYFLIHLGGKTYGVRSAEATLLACSFDSVVERLARRGSHVASFGTTEAAEEIAGAYLRATFEETESNERFFGMSADALTDLMAEHEIVWAPDGDQAFDDGSHVLHFDQGSQVRLIGFKNRDDVSLVATLSDVCLNAEEFYTMLNTWKESFEAEWASKKVAD